MPFKKTKVNVQISELKWKYKMIKIKANVIIYKEN